MAQQALTQSRPAGAIKFNPGRILLYLLVLVLIVLFGFPLFWTVMSSLKTPQEMATFPPPWLPAVPQWSNYERVLLIPRIPVRLWAWNSLFVTLLSTAGVVMTA